MTGSSAIAKVVAEGRSADELRRVIESCGRGERRALAINGPSGARGRRGGGDGGGGGRESIIGCAVRMRRVDLVKVLLDNGARPPEGVGGGSSLAPCIAFNSLEAARRLLRAGRADANERVAYRPDHSFASSLSQTFASAQEVLSATEGLRRFQPGHGGAGLSTAPFFCRPVHMCVVPPLPTPQSMGFPRLDILEALVTEFGADVDGEDSEGNTALSWVTRQRYGDHEKTVALLLRLGADPNKRARDGTTPLMVFCGQGMVNVVPPDGALRADVVQDLAPTAACVKALLRAGAKATGVGDTIGTTALALAAISGGGGVPEMVRLLLEEGGADPSERNHKTGATALHNCGCWTMRDTSHVTMAPVAELLFDAGLDPRAVDNEGATLVHSCAWRGDLAMLRLLARRGVSADDADAAGVTPLLAACEGHGRFDPSEAGPFLTELARLTSVEARRAVLPSDGRSALDLLIEGPAAKAKKKGWYKRLVALLAGSGAPCREENAEAVRAIEVAVGAVEAAVAGAARG